MPVRPHHVSALVAGRGAADWVRRADFDEGSRFEHVEERLILLLHAAGTSPGHVDATNHWHALDQAERDRLDRCAESLGARVGLALATGREDAVANHPEPGMWRE